MLCGACDRIAPLVWAVDKVSLRRGYLGWVWERWWKLSRWRKGISDKGIPEHSRQRNQQRFWSNKTKSIRGTVTGITRGFPNSSVGKESACNAGDPHSIPASGRSAREGIAYPLQYSWASLVAQLVKNPPAMWETWVWSLGWEDPLEKGKATHSSVLSRAQLSDFHFTSLWYRALTLLMWEDFLGLQG